jgi:hypothetical protein
MNRLLMASLFVLAVALPGAASADPDLPKPPSPGDLNLPDPPGPAPRPPGLGDLPDPLGLFDDNSSNHPSHPGVHKHKAKKKKKK